MALWSEIVSAVHAYWHLAISSLVVLCVIRNRLQKNLHKVPGPWLNSISTLPRMWSVYRGSHHLDDLALHAKYGKVVRVAPNLVSVADTREINQLYGIKTKFIKSPFYDLSAVYDEDGLVPDPFVIRTDKALHSRMKRNAANAYSMNGLVQFEPWIDPVVGRLQAILDEHAEAHTVCDLGELLKRFAMDAVCSLTFGSDFAYLEKGDQFNFFKTFDLFTAYMSIFGHVAWLHPYLLGNSRVAALATRGDLSSPAMFKLTQDELQKSREKLPNESDAMTFLARLALNQSANPASITDREIVAHAFGNVAAGSDTTAIAMRSIVYHLLMYPETKDRLCAEVRSKLSMPVHFNAANDLPYLRAVIQEGMRMHPSVGQVLGRVVPPGGARVGDYQLGGGAEVGMSPWVLHRDPEVFPDPDSFKPERWIALEDGSNENQLRAMHRSFFAFGHGSHTCSGKHISIMEVTKLIPMLLLRYDLELVHQGGGYQFANLWFTSQKNLNVRLRRL